MARHGHSASGAPFAEVAGDVGASPPRTATSSPPNGGNCTNRAATRRRHAGRMLLMVQNPHRQPDIHPGAEGGGSESTGALRDTSLATTPAGGDPTTSRQISHVISPRSLFEIARKRCNSNDVDSTFELIAGELRATLMGRGRAWPSFETTRRRHAEGRLLMLQNPHRQPDIHPGAEGGGSESTGALRDTSLATTPAGGDPTTSRQISHVISPRSLFEIARKRCNSNDVDSTFELIAGELRATLMGRGRAWPSFETTRRRHAEGRLLMLQNPHHYPWRHAPSLASRSLTSAGLPGGRR